MICQGGIGEKNVNEVIGSCYREGGGSAVEVEALSHVERHSGTEGLTAAEIASGVLGSEWHTARDANGRRAGMWHSAPSLTSSLTFPS